MGNRRLRQRCARIVRGIDVPVPFDAATLCQRVGDRLGRPVHLLPTAMPDDVPCGLVISTDTAHYVCYDTGTTPLHQQHIVAHELGHLLAGHGTQPFADASASRTLLPTLDPALVNRVLSRTPRYAQPAEAEAETIADILLQRANPWAGEAAWEVPAEAATAVDRLTRALGRAG